MKQFKLLKVFIVYRAGTVGMSVDLLFCNVFGPVMQQSYRSLSHNYLSRNMLHGNIKCTLRIYYEI